MIGLYNTNALYYQRIRQANRDACGVLLRTMEAKAKVDAGKWSLALDVSLGKTSLNASLFSIPLDLAIAHCFQAWG
jgi:nuclear pore complex protein Nup93